MGVVADSFEDLPEPDALPGREWGIEGWTMAVGRYAATRRALLALDRELEDELADETVRMAQSFKQQLASAVKTFKDDADRVSPLARDGVVTNFISLVSPVAEQVALKVRPMLRSDAVDRLVNAASVADARSRVEEAQSRLDALEEKAKVIIERVGVGRLAAHYEDEGSYQAKAARRWLTAVGVCTALLVLIVIWLIWEASRLSGTPEWETLAALLASKALALGVLSYATGFCAKNYRSHRHLHATYRQRMAALDTYSLMALSLKDDPEDRRLVLVELARAVFAPSDTGLTPSSQGDKTIIENTVPLVAAIRGG